jgi:hypothetical protein
LLRELGLGQAAKVRCDRVPDEPGAEMQHDTTVYRVKLNGRPTKVVASLLYLRYSKRRYLKFYRAFNRFAMKCFLHEALMYWSHCAPLCVIDNTNLARLRGSGSQAVIVPEMARFGKRYGFEFVCHALGHANRKAGEERSFWTVQTNFLPGREFRDMDDLNAQAFTWATERNFHRPISKTKLIPATLFEHERSFLIELSPHLPAPYCEHQRGVDQYGFASFDGNGYWIPGDDRQDVKVLQHADRLKFYRGRQFLIEYPLPPHGMKNERFAPEGQPKPKRRPRKRPDDSRQRQQRLRAMDEQVAAYLDRALAREGVQRHRFVCELFTLSRRMPPDVFVKATARALHYGVFDLRSLERIAWCCMSSFEAPLPEAEVDETFRDRSAYQQGYLTDSPDLSQYEDQQDDADPSEDDHG